MCQDLLMGKRNRNHAQHIQKLPQLSTKRSSLTNNMALLFQITFRQIYPFSMWNFFRSK